MLKHVYRALALILIFCGALFLFGKNMKEVTSEKAKPVDMGAETFPILSLQSQGITMNRLYGYCGDMSSELLRESITPIGQDKLLTINIREYEVQITKVKYEIWNLNEEEKMDAGEVSALRKTKTGRKTTLALDGELDTSREYALKITLITNLGKKIHYFTRIKYYVDDSFLTQKLDFVNEFHKATLDKNENYVVNYVEPSGEEDATTLAYVNIYSSMAQVNWGQMKPKALSKIVPTIKEFNIETACVQLSYFIQAETASGKEKFLVREFYRVRHTSDRLYLLYFERTMEAIYDVKLTSLTQKELKLGITADSDCQPQYTEDYSRIAYVRNGKLYYYDTNKNEVRNIYSFYTKESTSDYCLYEEHRIRTIRMEKNGDLYFAVYGYIPRGAYEGKLAIILYKYHAKEGMIEELVYMPLDTSFQMMKEEFEDLCYVNDSDVFYFGMGGNLYSYNIVARNLFPIAKNILESDYQVLKESHVLVWMQPQENGLSKELHILSLDGSGEKIIKADEGNALKLIGIINENIVYGEVQESRLAVAADGTWTIPLHKLTIADAQGNAVKGYARKKQFVTKATIENNVIKMQLSEKKGGKWRPIGEDSIINQTEAPRTVLAVNPRVTDVAMTEWYVSLPSKLKLKEVPTLTTTQKAVIRMETSLHLEKEEKGRELYFVAARGGITTAYTELALAIQKADEQMGAVVTTRNRLLWERGGKFLSSNIGGVTMQTVGGGLDSREACAYMVLKANHIAVSTSELKDLNLTAAQIMSQYGLQAVSLQDCTLDEVLYFVSAGKPVVALKSATEAVVITGYTTTSVTYMDPSTGRSETLGITNATNQFQAAGNVFVSYRTEEN